MTPQEYREKAEAALRNAESYQFTPDVRKAYALAAYGWIDLYKATH